MGGKSSKEDSFRQNSSLRSTSSASASSWSAHHDPYSGYGQGGYTYESQPPPSYPAQPYYAPPPPPQNHGYEPHANDRVANHYNKKKLERKYSRIADNYNSIDEVRDALHASFVQLVFFFSLSWD